jgi:hypothetical protein
MGIRLKSGRLFTDSDNEESARVIIVNDAFVRRFMRGNSPQGAQVVLGDQRDDRFADQPRTVVGVVGDTLDGIEATNIAVMAGVLSVLALVSFTAVLAPALRARKVDPNHVLRA